ncbi:MAG TPA: HD domain-containing phosphohydrolase [Bdellovibrionota bacterium]|jgi:putative nucleotidyltransferase with HDIG domain|nr:HD domain-containing phosphohydrolase [Bdellovibrionota bacterium]
MSVKWDTPDYRDSSGLYIPISVESLRTGAADDFDVYLRTGSDYFLIKPKGSSISDVNLNKYAERTPYLYIRTTDQDPFFKRVDKYIDDVITSDKVPLRQKAALLSDKAVDIVDKIFADPSHPEHLKAAHRVTQNFLSFVAQDRHAFLHLVDLSINDHYTYAHSVGVAAYCLATALAAGYQGEQVVNIGVAGLLHDIGKSQIDPAIINKKGPLDEREWGEMKKHPQLGGELLRAHKNIPDIVIVCTESHHENNLGTGYPRGLIASKLDPMVGIVSISDTFSALTTKRSYSHPRDSLSALKLMKENIKAKFDQELFMKFVKLFLAEEKKAG